MKCEKKEQGVDELFSCRRVGACTCTFTCTGKTLLAASITHYQITAEVELIFFIFSQKLLILSWYVFPFDYQFNCQKKNRESMNYFHVAD